MDECTHTRNPEDLARLLTEDRPLSMTLRITAAEVLREQAEAVAAWNRRAPAEAPTGDRSDKLETYRVLVETRTLYSVDGDDTTALDAEIASMAASILAPAEVPQVVVEMYEGAVALEKAADDHGVHASMYSQTTNAIRITVRAILGPEALKMMEGE